MRTLKAWNVYLNNHFPNQIDTLPASNLPLQRLYKEKGESMKHSYTLSGDLPEMLQAKLNATNLSEVRHMWLQPGQLTADGIVLRAPSCGENSSSLLLVTLQSCYKESWTKLRDGGYKLRLDAIPFQSAKASAEILSDVRHWLQKLSLETNLL